MKVATQVYGPYTTQQMCAYAKEGRLAEDSLVNVGNARNWQRADSFDDLIPVFAEALAANENTAPQSPTIEVSADNDHGQEADNDRGHQTDNDHYHEPEDLPKNDRHKYILIFDLKATAGHEIEAGIRSLGRASTIMRDAWALSSKASLATVQNTLIPIMNKMDGFFVFDARQGKMAWWNLGPELDAKIREVWK